MWPRLKIGAAAILLVAFLTLPVYYHVGRGQFMDNMNCEDLGQGALAIIIIDTSDPYDEVDISRVLAEIEERVSALPKCTRYVLVQPNEREPYAPVEALNRCNVPALPETAALIISRDLASQHEQRRQKALAETRQAVQRLLRAKSRRGSPLLETIIALSKRHDFRYADRVQIFMYSDMEQNSKIFSIYRSPAQPTDFARLPLEKISLRGATLVVERIVRTVRKRVGA